MEGLVVSELARAGLFRLRATLVGSMAYQTYSGILGVRLDDIARTGQTLMALRHFLRANNFRKSHNRDEEIRLSMMRFAVMLAVTPKETAFWLPADHVCYTTGDKFFRLPWSGLNSDFALAFRSVRQGSYSSEFVLKLYDRLGAAPEFALDVARQFIDEGLSGHGINALAGRKIGLLT
ncbi:GSU2403 family nucleotidyltransferase fold protein [Bradyrhizobium niftali]|uniref:Nucleotidyltransferase-like domain-containing protein n=1 Tax=Bradyrhizobium niftali TaxID=2560055 RepID=A0A4Y9LZA2_9BRAD|nr:GSU2403 family nucleotidyltransferase fold protein [Bradyrhizobium niftali]TFV48259.1 hypothetical protein E4K65_12635 [Bradyrhizobium niftali]